MVSFSASAAKRDERGESDAGGDECSFASGAGELRDMSNRSCGPPIHLSRPRLYPRPVAMQITGAGAQTRVQPWLVVPGQANGACNVQRQQGSENRNDAEMHSRNTIAKFSSYKDVLSHSLSATWESFKRQPLSLSRPGENSIL